MKQALSMLALVNFPVMIGLAVVAKPLIIVLLTDKWLPAVPYLQVLCIVGLIYPLQGANINIINALGRSDLYLKVQIINKVLILLNVILTYRFGIIAMIWGHCVISGISYFFNVYYNNKLLNYRFTEQVGDLLPFFAKSLLMGLAVYLISYIPFTNSLVLLIAQVLVGLLFYLILSLISKHTVFLDFFNIVKKSLLPKSK
jgi:O-antigen/teichoic acid export membrane protein